MVSCFNEPLRLRLASCQRSGVRDTFRAMSVLEMKQELSRMSKRERQELHAYLIRLKHETPEWKRAAAKRVAEMKKGRVMTGAEIEARISAR